MKNTIRNTVDEVYKTTDNFFNANKNIMNEINIKNNNSTNKVSQNIF